MIEAAERAGPAQAGRHDHRADVGQHRSRPGDRRRAQGLSLHLRDGRQAVGREAAAPAGLRRRGRPVPDQRRPRIARELLLGRGPARPRHPGRVQARPVLERGEPGRPRADDRPGAAGSRPTAGSPTSSRASGPAARSPAPPAYLKAHEPGDPGHRRRPGGQRPVRRHGPAVPDRGGRRGLPPGHLRPDGRRPLGPRQRPRRVRDGPPADPRGGDPGRRVVRDGDGRRARGGPRPDRDRTAGTDAVVVVLLPDSGRSYLSKIYNDEWMRANGLLATTGAVVRVGDLLDDRHHAGPLPDVVAGPDDPARRRGDRDPPGVRDQPAAGVGARRRATRSRASSGRSPRRACSTAPSATRRSSSGPSAR